MFTKKPPALRLPEPPPVHRFEGQGGRYRGIENAPTPPPVPITEMKPSDRIAQAIITQAFRESAEQITLTPNETGALTIHYLTVGEWQHTMTVPPHVAPSLVIAFKDLAGLPVWEHRMVLHGLIAIQYGAADYDAQVSVVPTRRGEKITLRLEAAQGE